MIGPIERIYAGLLDRQYEVELFGGLPGFERKGSGYIACCPFHEDTLPTLVIYSDRPEYFCFACSCRGDWVRYLQLKEGLSFEDARSLLSGRAGIEARGYGRSLWERELARTVLLENAASFFTTELFAPPGEEVLRYLYRRGYAMGEVEGSGFGFYPGFSQLKEYLLSQGMNDVLASEEPAGIWSRDAESFRLTIPYRDFCGRLMGIIGRDIAKAGPEAYRPLTGLSPLVDTPFLIYKARGREEIIIVEGLFDALLVDQIGIKPAIAIGRSGLSTGRLDAIEASGIRRCILALGGGLEKRQRTLQTARLIESRGLEAVILPIPDEYEDLDRFIRSTDLHDFKKLLKKGRSVEQWSAGICN